MPKGPIRQDHVH